jgi:hypothetical protein
MLLLLLLLLLLRLQQVVSHVTNSWPVRDTDRLSRIQCALRH